MSIGSQKIEIDARQNMVINRDYAPILSENGLMDFDGFYQYGGGTLVKQIRERSVTRLEVHPCGKTSVFFLKRHIAERLGVCARIAAWVSGRSTSPGMAEFETICEFRENGIPTVAPVAAGERQLSFFRYESFLVTEDVSPFISLEKLIHDHPEKLSGPIGQQRKHRIISAIARLARTMHEKGLNHRDFNATHVLIGPEDKDGEFSLALFDLQRVDRKKWMRFKWGIKILAELFYSMPAPLFDENDRTTLFQTYHRTKRLRLTDRALLVWIQRKTSRIARHTRKIRARRRSSHKAS
ncbi:MAG: lipopolysaccharide kinase InaA family protein [Desulfobacterales bacterium]|jgi:hypothetical protein|nr:lipopolysaccharide kinase InaA family protein [Desulfobacterales bacterium]